MSTITGNEKIAKVVTRPTGRMVAYWSITIILAFSIALSGIGQLMRYGGNVELVTTIGLVSRYISRTFSEDGNCLESLQS
jgi:hypothetical protein